MYLEKVLTLYYDTEYADQARMGIIVSYILEEDLDAAWNYLEENGARFAAPGHQEEAGRYIEMAREGKFDLSFYIRLYQ